MLLYSKFVYLIILVLASINHITADTILDESDFYKLLGIERNADNRDIRKAFKKLALTLHPDKNSDDPNANEKFLKINRAYEVLKDDKSRNVYDLHGEKGLKNDFFENNFQQYQTWNYYHESFGIYDNDEEIITLSKADFDFSIQNVDFIWFINFYSGRCSHCHHLAPEWRKLAKKLHLIVRIAAVNCDEDRPLCQKQEVRYYPSLILYYHGKTRYEGKRNAESLEMFVLEKLKISQNIFQDSNSEKLFEKINEISLHQKRLSVVIVCYDNKECLFDNTKKFLTYKLNHFANVLELTCNDNEKEICKHFDISESKVVLFSNIKEDPKNYIEISTRDSVIDVSEVFKRIISHFPKIEFLTKKELTLLNDCVLVDSKSSDCELISNWIIVFCRTNEESNSILDIELKSFVSFMPETKVRKVLCSDQSSSKTVCQKFSIKTYPKVYAFKNSAFFEPYFGRMNGVDLLNFAQESFKSNFQTLTDEEFENKVPNSNDPWVFEFYAPWCPMCKTAMQTLRKVSQSNDRFVPRLQFGAIDCTIYPRLCHQYNIRGYPTLIVYNQSVPHHYQDVYDEIHLANFIQNILFSKVIELDPTQFSNLIEKRTRNELWAIDFYSPRCMPCIELAPIWRRLSIMMQDEPNVRFGQLNCIRWNAFCRQLQISSYPTMRIYPTLHNKEHKSTFYNYNSRFRGVYELRAWLYDFLQSPFEDINNTEQFETILSSTEPYLVDFYHPQDHVSRQFTPDLIRLAKNLTHTNVKFVRINCRRFYNLCGVAMVDNFPNARFYSGITEADSKQLPSGLNLELRYSTVPEMSWQINHKLQNKFIQIVKDEL